MSDLFDGKAQDWDQRPIPAQISSGVGPLIAQTQALNLSTLVLDFGAGTGLVCAHVAPHVDKILAVDISAAMLEKLAAKPELQGKVEPICQDILETPLDVKVDLIVSAMAMHHVADTERLFQTFADHLSSGGRLALADLDKEDGGFHPDNIEGVFHKGFDRDSLRALASASGFENVEFRTAVEVTRNDVEYPIFLLTATKK